MLEHDTESIVKTHWSDNGGKLPVQEGSHFAESKTDDAFSTIIQWLHWRISFTRGKDRPNEKLFLPTFTQ